MFVGYSINGDYCLEKEDLLKWLWFKEGFERGEKYRGKLF